MSSRYPRIIFMDLEGTLLKKAKHLDNGKVAPSAWTLLAECLGAEALRQEEETKERWLRGFYDSYIDWMQDTIKIHQRFGLTAELYNQVMHSVEVTPGAGEAISLFHQRGAITVVISGGFKALSDRLQREFGIDHAIAACEYFFNPENGLLQYWNLLPSDYKIKVDFMRMFMKEYQVQRTDCVFIGDGQNDVWMARAVDFSIAFNAHPALRKVSTYSIDQPEGEEDFLAVCRHIDSHIGKKTAAKHGRIRCGDTRKRNFFD